MQTTPAKKLAQFGWIVGGILLLIALYPLVMGKPDTLHWWALLSGGVLCLAALVYPSALRWPYQVWMQLGHALGWVNTRILLTIIFYGLILPMGLVLRLIRKDPLSLRMDPLAKTYKIAVESRPQNFRRQF